MIATDLFGTGNVKIEWKSLIVTTNTTIILRVYYYSEGCPNLYGLWLLFIFSTQNVAFVATPQLSRSGFRPIHFGVDWSNVGIHLYIGVACDYCLDVLWSAVSSVNRQQSIDSNWPSFQFIIGLGVCVCSVMGGGSVLDSIFGAYVHTYSLIVISHYCYWTVNQFWVCKKRLILKNSPWWKILLLQ